MGHTSVSGLKELIKSRNKDFDEVFIRIILQKSEFFLIISIVIGLSIWITLNWMRKNEL